MEEQCTQHEKQLTGGKISSRKGTLTEERRPAKSAVGI
jgi:hypothetical protein